MQNVGVKKQADEKSDLFVLFLIENRTTITWKTYIYVYSQICTPWYW